MNRSRVESHPVAMARPSLDSAAQNRPRATGKWYAALLAEDKGRKGDWLLGKINGRRNREVEAGGSNPHGCYGTRIYTVWCRECDGFLRAAWAVDFKPFPADLNLPLCATAATDQPDAPLLLHVGQDLLNKRRAGGRDLSARLRYCTRAGLG